MVSIGDPCLYLQSMDSNGQSLDYPNLHFAPNICMSNPK